MFLLKNDKQAEKLTYFWHFFPSTSICNVPKGSLLTKIPEKKQVSRTDGKATHNYQSIDKDHTITLHCDDRDVEPLNDKLKQLEQCCKEQQQQLEELHKEHKKCQLQKEQLQNENRQHIQQLKQKERLVHEQSVHYIQQLREEQGRTEELQKRLDTGVQMHSTAQLMKSIQVNRAEVQIQSRIGKGAWAVVEKGIFKGQEVAVKSPHLPLLQYPHMVDRMRHEIEIMAQIHHPNLIRIIAAVLDEEAEQLQAPPLIVTELLDTNLRLAYEGKWLQMDACVTILRDVAYALHYLHEYLYPIVHGDISAPNVLLMALPLKNAWRAKVSDFGSANFVKLAPTPGEGAVIYTAPEAFPADKYTELPPFTTKIDVYSYGILICEVATSKLPLYENYSGMLCLVKTKWKSMYNLIIRCTMLSPLSRPTMAQVLDELYKLSSPFPQVFPDNTDTIV